MPNNSKWVRHLSGQGEKWEVLEQRPPGVPIIVDESEWLVRAKESLHAWHTVPKSEYHLCEPPEIWRDVTAECEYRDDGRAITGLYWQGESMFSWQGYRLRKVPCGGGWAFVVEKKGSKEDRE